MIRGMWSDDYDKKTKWFLDLWMSMPDLMWWNIRNSRKNKASWFLWLLSFCLNFYNTYLITTSYLNPSQALFTVSSMNNSRCFLGVPRLICGETGGDDPVSSYSWCFFIRSKFNVSRLWWRLTSLEIMIQESDLYLQNLGHRLPWVMVTPILKSDMSDVKNWTCSLTAKWLMINPLKISLW